MVSVSKKRTLQEVEEAANQINGEGAGHDEDRNTGENQQFKVSVKKLKIEENGKSDPPACHENGTGEDQARGEAQDPTPAMQQQVQPPDYDNNMQG